MKKKSSFSWLAYREDESLWNICMSGWTGYTIWTLSWIFRFLKLQLVSFWNDQRDERKRQAHVVPAHFPIRKAGNFSVVCFSENEGKGGFASLCFHSKLTPPISK